MPPALILNEGGPPLAIRSICAMWICRFLSDEIGSVLEPWRGPFRDLVSSTSRITHTFLDRRSHTFQPGPTLATNQTSTQSCVWVGAGRFYNFRKDICLSICTSLTLLKNGTLQAEVAEARGHDLPPAWERRFFQASEKVACVNDVELIFCCSWRLQAAGSSQALPLAEKCQWKVCLALHQLFCEFLCSLDTETSQASRKDTPCRDCDRIRE